MRICCRHRVWGWFLLLIPASALLASALSKGSWTGSLRDQAGNPIAEATVHIRLVGGPDYTAQTSPKGVFVFADISAGSYELFVENHQKTWKSSDQVLIKDGVTLTAALQLSSQMDELH